MASEAKDGSLLVANIGKVCAIIVCGFLALAAVVSILDQLGLPPDGLLAVLLVASAGTFALIAFAARSNDPKAFFVAARTVPGIAGAVAALPLWLPAGSALALVGTLYALGYDGTATLIGIAAGLVLTGVLFAPYLRRSGAYTVADFLGARFGGGVRLLAAVAVVAISLVLLVNVLAPAAEIAARALSVPVEPALAALVLAVLLVVLPGGCNSTTWSALPQSIVFLVGFLVPVAIFAVQHHDPVFPFTAYGDTLASLSKLETDMLVSGLADARSLKPHVKPFLHLDASNFHAVVLTLMLGIAVLPHLLTRHLQAVSPAEARGGSAWMLGLGLIVLLSAPAYAALAKLQVYTLVDHKLAFANLPDWMEELSRADLVRIHGISLKLVDDVAAALGSGAADMTQVTTYLGSESPESSAALMDLKEPVRILVVDAAREAIAGSGRTAWDILRDPLLPAVAAASGNKTGLVTLSALDIDPEALALALPRLAGQPPTVAALAVIGALAVAMSVAAATLVTAANTLAHDVYFKMLGRTTTAGRRIWAARLLLVALAAAAGLVSHCWHREAALALSLVPAFAAATLFPALVLAIWWRRANGAGVALGLVAGGTLTLYYAYATNYAPVEFYDTWSTFSNGGPAAARKFAELKSAWSLAAGDAKAAAWTALETYVQGGASRTGYANWFGLGSAAIAVIAVPAGFLLAVLASLATAPPDAERDSFVTSIRRPGQGRPIRHDETEPEPEATSTAS